MQEMWHIRAEITVQPEDFVSGNTAGFMNIITWASSDVSAANKIAAYFKSFEWQIIEVLEAKIVSLEGLYENDEFQDMVERASTNENAILCGTFHGYKVN